MTRNFKIKIGFQSSEQEVKIAPADQNFIGQLAGGQKLGEKHAQLLKYLSGHLAKAQALHSLLASSFRACG